MKKREWESDCGRRGLVYRLQAGDTVSASRAAFADMLASLYPNNCKDDERGRSILHDLGLLGSQAEHSPMNAG